MAFNQREQDIIKYGLENGKSRAEVEEAIRSFRQGITVSEPKIQEVEKPGFLSRAGTALKERFGEVKKTFGETARGEINPAETGIRVVGDVAGGVGDIVGAAISPQVEKLAQKEWAKPAFEALASGIEKYEEWKNSSELNSRTGEVLEGVVNITDLAGATGLGKITGKAAVKTGKEVIETAGKVAVKASEFAEPAIKVGKKVAKEITPTRTGTINKQIVRALDLTQGDVSNIRLSTRNDVGEWVSNKNLIGGNKKDTIKNINDFVNTQYKNVRGEISKVENIYKTKDVPRVKESLKLLDEELTGILGQEKALKEVKNLLKQNDYKLIDVQRTKELLDKQFDLYKATGDVKAGQVKTGLANVRKELREFLEKEVKDNTGADISIFNNDVATGMSISKLAEKRATRGLTRAGVSLSDLGVFGGGSLIGTPLFGAAALVVKRILESSTMRLQLAKLLKSLPTKKIEAIKTKLLKGDVPKEIKDIAEDFKTPAVGKTVPKTVSTLEQQAKKYKSADEFVEEAITKTPDDAMAHRPTFTKATADNISQEVSEMGIPNFYERPREYAYGGKEYDESIEALLKIKDKPDSEITIYRASPKKELRSGDWVTLSKEKARLESLDENVPVNSFKVTAKDVQFAGDDITEFGYYPQKEINRLTDIWNKSNKN